MERRLLYPGCLVLACLQDYELSARRVLGKIGVELEDMHEFACCASSIAPSFTDEWINLAAYNLALAEARGRDIVTLCGSCTKTLRDAARILDGDARQLGRVNQKLAEIGLSYSGRTKVTHIIEVMDERLDEVAAGSNIEVNIRVALQHPCNVSRPGELMQFDDPWRPQKMRQVVQAAGISVVDFDQEDECCGSALLMSEEEPALNLAKRKLSSAIRAGAEGMVVSCGNCAMLLKNFQHKISKSAPGLSLPVIFLPQIVGLAMGIPAVELGMKA
ncbi:MAG: CoB--CoM heterodisulfide reductase iron-sulfur subunit B family protein [Actinobacteria bacterium]|nr:CoB--CoM heterodisulfide reductase iron-sulfur subunit B family protein [Actinomycetota bacterium]